MFVDIDESQTHMDNYKKFNNDLLTIDGVELNVRMLTYGMWHEINQIAWTLPPQMGKCIKQFEKYFISKKSNTVLKLLVEDNCEISTVYLPKTYILICTSLQIAILWAFNQSTIYTYNELRTKIGISDSKVEVEFKYCLLSLCNPTSKIICKSNAKKQTFSSMESLELNMQFVNKAMR